MRKVAYEDNLFSMDVFGHVRYKGRVWLHEDEFFKTTVLSELNNSQFIVHLVGT